MDTMLLKEIFKGKAYILKYVLYSISFFLVGIFLGYYTALVETEEVILIFEQILDDLKGLETIGPVTLFLIIFLNNSIKTFVMMLLGIFFGLAPAFFLFSNGYMLGIISYIIIQELSISTMLLGILPHGIIEIARHIFDISKIKTAFVV